MITIFMSEAEYQRMGPATRQALLKCASRVFDGDELDEVRFDAARQFELNEDDFRAVATAAAGGEI